MSSQSSRELTLLILTAAVLGVVDSMIPRPLPFFRIGLANIPSVICVIRMGWLRTLELNTTRTMAVALVTGVIGTPTFILSLAGASASATVMSAFHRYFASKISTVGISISGAVASLWVQLLAASIILHDIPLGKMVPVLTLWGVLTGLLVGVLAKTALLKLFDYGVLRREEG